MTQKARPLRDGDRDKGQRQGLQEAHIIPPATIPADLAVEINAEHQAAFGKAREALEHARRAGELLLQAKAAVAHGDWAMWLSENITFSERTGQTYMQVARHWTAIQAKSAAVADLTLRQALTEIADKRPRVVKSTSETPTPPVRGLDRIHDAVEVDQRDHDGGVQVQVYACLRDAWDEADVSTRHDFLLDDDVKAELLKLVRAAP